jgi:hypothetical protein
VVGGKPAGGVAGAARRSGGIRQLVFRLRFHG